MLESLLTAVAGAVVATISAGGYLGVVLLMAIESACIPLPSEMIMPFAGYLASTGRFTLVMAATAGAVGCNLGSAVAYEIGRHGGRPLVERWGSYILLGRHDVELADRFFARWGSIAVLVARLLPVVRTFIALPAGLAAMSRWRFHVYTFVGSWPWCFALAYVGYVLGERWASDPRLREFMHRFDAVVAAGLAVLVAWWIWRHWRQRPRREKAD
ncbi:MAG: DedA family protein [Geminicoccaceae bacterium]